MRRATLVRSMAPRNSALPQRDNIHETGVLRGSFARAEFVQEWQVQCLPLLLLLAQCAD